ncbi:MAG: hypothetical protein GX859_00935 [Corynebacterium humireducens]|jgi:hypothetical protein|uniref:Secreted protein n=1 Tax=Corynebacterium humireducens TaxID=1223514 RepID=A0A7X6PKW4_9CORY|nr:hypothetical protein [Corynebacterium humireducens]
MKHVKYFAVLCTLSCGLALASCGTDTPGDATDSADTTTTTAGKSGSSSIPLNSDGTVDSEEFRRLFEAAARSTTSEIAEVWRVDSTSREPLSPEPDITITDRNSGTRVYSKTIFSDSVMEDYIADGQSWIRFDEGEWTLEGPFEETDPEVSDYSKFEVRIIDLDERRFEVERQLPDEDEPYTVEMVLDENFHTVEQFMDVGDGEALLQKSRNINQPVEFPEGLPGN